MKNEKTKFENPRNYSQTEDYDHIYKKRGFTREE